MTAPQVLKAMCAKYAALTSYSDEGSVVRQGAPPASVVFRTRFLRPSFFRFEWTDAFRDNLGGARAYEDVLWCDGASTFLSSNSERPRQVPCLALGVAEATGVSMGAAQTVAAMLMEEVGGFLFTELERVSFADTVPGSREVYHIEGCHPAGEQWQVSVGMSDLLLWEVTMRDQDGEVTIETHSAIRVDEAVEKDIFQFERYD